MYYDMIRAFFRSLKYDYPVVRLREYFNIVDISIHSIDLLNNFNFLTIYKIIRFFVFLPYKPTVRGRVRSFPGKTRAFM